MKVLSLADIGLAISTTLYALQRPPGGGYPDEVTALGDNALFSLTTGNHNTALGFEALYSDTPVPTWR